MTLKDYMAKRRYFEIAAWILFLSVGFAANVAVEWIEVGSEPRDDALWEIFAWEGTSHIVLLVLMPVILWFDHHFPLRLDTWTKNLAAHGAFTVLWSLAHVTLMYWARVWIYVLHANNDGYYWENWWGDFGYEYLKDFRAYFLFLGLIYLYRFVLRRIQGEAGYLSEGADGGNGKDVTDRFLIKKLGREFLVRVDEIDWIEASGNYVNLHVGHSVYPLRETMTGINERLLPHGFQRVHRSAIVNLDRVSEIIPYDTGDGEARLSSDAKVPVSRRFRKELRDRLG